MENRDQDIKLPDDKFIPREDFFRLVISSLQDYSILTTDKNLIINCWCAGSVKIFGYNAAEVIGKPISILFTEEDTRNDIPQQEMQKALTEGKASDNRWHVAKDGNLFFAYGLSFPLLDDNNEPVGYVKILRDLTERKIAEDALRKKMKELEELNTHKENILAILSHDLRSPLGSIIEISEYLKTSIDELDQGEVKQMLDILNQASTDELNMLDYLLEWARIKYASEAFSPALTPLAQCIAKVYEMFNELAYTNRVNLHNEVDKYIQVYADKKMLISIIQNLVSNALKFTPPGGHITISATNVEDSVMIKVQDTGVGMSPEQLDKLFTPKLKTLAQTRKEKKGAGIGLLLVKGFLEKNGGDICVESTEGQGTTFFFTLPSHKPSHLPVTPENIMMGEGEG